MTQTPSAKQNGHSQSAPHVDAKTMMGTPSVPTEWTSDSPPVAVPPQEVSDNAEAAAPPQEEQPDIWNYLLVGILSIFYLASLISTFISSQMLLYLLSGGGILIPMFGMKVPITEAVGLMGTGLLEGASLSDAYLEHKQQLSGSKKWLSKGGRFLGFIGQWLLYYMALGTLLFTTADVSSLSTETLENAQPEEAVLVLEPPTLLHGVFVGTLTGAWSYASNYVGVDALLFAVSRLRRRKKAQEQDAEAEDLEFFLSLLAQLQQILKDFEMAREMEALAQQLKLIYTRLDTQQVYSDLSDVFYQGISEILTKIPDSKLKQKGWSRQKLKDVLAQTMLSPHPSVAQPNIAPAASPFPPPSPGNWHR